VESLGTAEKDISDLNDYGNRVERYYFNLEIEYDFPAKKLLPKSSC
jgi:hypothetical protein